MSLFDSLKGAFGSMLQQAETGALPGLLTQALGASGGLQGILNTLQQNGMGAQVSSWLGHGPNQPITVDEIRSALGSQKVHDLAAQFGLPVDQVLGYLSEHLPTAVDQASPNGTLKPGV